MKQLFAFAALLCGCSLLFSPTKDKYNEASHCGDNTDNDGDGLIDEEDTEDCTPDITLRTSTNVDSFSLIAFDANGDSAPDIAAAAINDGFFSILINNGDGSLSLSQSFDMTPGVNSEIAGDVDNDGDQDLIVSHFGNRLTFLVENDGDGSFKDPVSLFDTANNPTDLIFIDANNDGLLDIAETTVNLDDGSNDGFIEIFLRNTDGPVAYSDGPIASTIGKEPFELVTSDFDSDTKADIAVVNHGSDTVAILTGDGSGNFSASEETVVCQAPFSLGIGQAHDDSLKDLVTACEQGGVVFLSANAFSLVAISLFTAFPLPLSDTPLVARFGGISENSSSGFEDIIVAQQGGALTTFFNSGLAESPFSELDLATYPIIGAPGEIFIDDMNSDGRLDVALANSGNKSIDILLNLGNGDLLVP